jgi:hypothetical protein
MAYEFHCSTHSTRFSATHDTDLELHFCAQCGDPWPEIREQLQRLGLTIQELKLNTFDKSRLGRHKISISEILDARILAAKNENELRQKVETFKVLFESQKNLQEAKVDAEERAKYPHEFNDANFCVYCGVRRAYWFNYSYNVGKPCSERYGRRKLISYKENLQLDKSYTVTMDAAGHKWYVKNDKTPATDKLVNIGTIDVVLHLTEWPEGVKKMQFRTLDGNLLPSGTYHARIVDVRVVKP